MKFCSIFSIFPAVRLKFGTRDAHKTVLINEFGKKKRRRRSESRTLRRGVNNFLSLLVTFIVR